MMNNSIFKEFARRCIAIWFIINGNGVIFNARLEVYGRLVVYGKDYCDIYIENNEFFKESNIDKIFFGNQEVS